MLGHRRYHTLTRLMAFCLLVLFTLVLSACSRLPETMAPTSAMAPGADYQLEPGNRVRIVVFNENNLSGEFTIDPNGNIFMPLVGNIPSSGMTARLLAQRIEDALNRGNYMREPKVSVEIQTFRPFYVMGEVRAPGEFPFTSGVTVLSAVARAGGYDYRAREGEVMLIRLINGEQKEFRANERTPLQPGDIIKVLERYF